MFTKSAHLYDLLYSFKDYAAESEMIMNLVPREAPRAHSMKSNY